MYELIPADQRVWKDFKKKQTQQYYQLFMCHTDPEIQGNSGADEKTLFSLSCWLLKAKKKYRSSVFTEAAHISLNILNVDLNMYSTSVSL